jgi:hypothetical protein
MTTATLNRVIRDPRSGEIHLPSEKVALSSNGCSRIFSRRASLVATILAASAFIFAEPDFAQVPSGSHPDGPEPSGSTIISSPSPTNSGEASNYSFDDPRWVALPSYDDPYESYSLRLLNRDALHPGPPPQQPAENLPGSTFGLQPPVGLVDPFGLSPVNPATMPELMLPKPELMLPETMGRPADALETPVR